MEPSVTAESHSCAASRDFFCALSVPYHPQLLLFQMMLSSSGLQFNIVISHVAGGNKL